MKISMKPNKNNNVVIVLITALWTYNRSVVDSVLAY